AEIRLFDSLFATANPEAGDDVMQNINAQSRTVLQAMLEPALAQAVAGERFQFEREGYFVADEIDHQAGQSVFNRILDLKDSFKPS
ncbi:MAG: hypothetical protein RLY58_1517, partial [Pseudomonadota bacterium]